MYILGLTIGHDCSAALIKDGRIVSAISAERIYGIKKTTKIDKELIDYVLGGEGITLDDVECVAIGGLDRWATGYNNYVRIFIPKYELQYVDFGKTHPSFNSLDIKDNYVEDYGYEILDDNWLSPPTTFRGTVKSIYVNLLIGDYRIDGYVVNHHTAHAASVFYTSNFDKSAVLTIDASGKNYQTSGSFHLGFDNRLNYVGSPKTMIGTFYDYMTDVMSLGTGLEKAGTLMGLSSYGKPNNIALNNWERFNSFGDESFMGADEHTSMQSMGSYLAQKPIIHLSYEHEEDTEILDKRDPRCRHLCLIHPDEKDGKEAMNLASSVQHVFEMNVLKAVENLFEYSHSLGIENLCLAGGSFLNCNSNYKILKNSKFKNIFIYPACGDDGLSVGAALYISHEVYRNDRYRHTPKELMYCGKSYENNSIGVQYDENIIAKMLSESKIIAWYQEGAEFGPRALGHRSFLANPLDSNMKDILNHRIKKREWFRPFAPVVLKEECKKYFDLDVESPFMLYTCPVKLPDLLPSITHVDGTARVQTVDRDDNPKYYDLIKKFGEITGVPVLLNTSLNINGKPIVETIEDALELFNTSDVDAIVINNRMIIK